MMNMRMMKNQLAIKLLLVVFMSLGETKAFSHDFTVQNKDGKTIYLNWNKDHTGLEVTYKEGSLKQSYRKDYWGDIDIPKSINYYGTIYNVTSIGSEAFYKCKGLTSVSIPNSVTSINSYAFWWCEKLTNVTIPSSVVSLELSAFQDCSSLSSVTIPDNVKSIKTSAFRNCKCITSIKIPNSVTFIGEGAFAGCEKLSSITILNNEVSIGGNAFYGTKWYDDQPDGLLYVCKVAYKYKGNMPPNTHITIKDGTNEIAGEAFQQQGNLASISIPNSVVKIGDNSFWNCTRLTSVDIPNSVTNIGSGAFQGCKNLNLIIVPNSVVSIGLYAFFETAWYDNQPDGLVYAGKVAYDYKGEMSVNTHVTIKEGTIGIAERAFAGCENMNSITIPNSVTNIGPFAFSGCKNLNSIVIPNSVTSIGGVAFYFCSGLKSVIIGTGIKEIGNMAFGGPFNGSGPNELEDLYCYAMKIPEAEQDVFDYTNIDSSTLHVPAALVDAYKQTVPWNGFGRIVAISDDDPMPTGIKENLIVTKNEFYDLNGRKVTPNRNGVYISKGKKIIK